MNVRRFRYRVLVALVVGVCCAVGYWPVSSLTHHGGETAILLMVPGLGAILWLGWPKVRRQSLWGYVVYLVVMVGVVWGAEAFAARMARGRVLWPEVLWAVYFIVAWRLAWSLYKRTVGTLGERYRRWGRMARRRGFRPGGQVPVEGRNAEWSAIADPTCGDSGVVGETAGKDACGTRGGADSGLVIDRRRWWLARGVMLIGPARFCLVVFLFAPLVFGSMIHRMKIGNRLDLEEYEELPVEDVSFETEDDLVLSGWFLPEAGSDKTVVICHGAGANKGNFISFLGLLHTKGYSGLIFDARAHGDSEGHTSTFGLDEVADVRAAVDWLKRERPEHARRVVGLGSSMGAMTLVRAAAEDDRIEAIVLDSCFVSAPLLAKQHMSRIPVVGQVLGKLVLASMSLHAGRSMWELDALPALEAVSPRPVLFIHGTEDVVIPPVNMEILFEAAGEPKEKWLGPGPHSNVLTTEYYEYQTRVLGFFDRSLGIEGRR